MSTDFRTSRQRPRSCSAQRHGSLTSSVKVLDSVNSIIANQSQASSEADTLTGVHLDNSSQFGIPPVFNAKGAISFVIAYTNGCIF